LFNKERYFVRLAVLTVILMMFLVGMSPVAEENEDTIRFGVVPWSESIALGGLIEYLLETEIGMQVKLSNPDVGRAYNDIKNKRLDLMIEAWLPRTHENYWNRVSRYVLNFGPVYEDAGLTWAVPDYVYEAGVRSVTDLGSSEVKKKLSGKITGIDPNSGIMQHSKLMIEKEYPELEGYELAEGTDKSMTEALQKAVQEKSWIVVTLWAPHDAYALYDLHSLEEPKNVLGGEEHINIIGREDFMSVFPNEVSEFLSRLHLPFSMEVELTRYYNELGDAYAAGQQFAENHPHLVDYWVRGPSAIE